MMQFNNLLQKKRLLLGITGSISAYKSLELIRLFIKAGATVQAIMTPAATKFITPLSVETLTQQPVLLNDNESWSSAFNHVKISYDCDLFLIAPCTVNTLSKLSLAIADNILLQSALAFKGPFLLAPAANTTMIENPFAKEAHDRLIKHGYHFVQTQSKQLACLSEGDGALAEPSEIFYLACRLLLKHPFWEQKEVIITGGGTVEKIDDVRYIGNFSSGKMAASLATALYCLGAHVTLITTKPFYTLAQHIKQIHCTDSHEMFTTLTQNIALAKERSAEKPLLFMAAAVSDFVVSKKVEGKLKKENLGNQWQLELTQNRDILASLNKDHLITIAFKAEYDPKLASTHALQALAKKKVDYIALNLISEHAFGSEQNALTLFNSKEKAMPIATNDKLTIAFSLAKLIADDQSSS